jgi:hypothetical protein
MSREHFFDSPPTRRTTGPTDRSPLQEKAMKTPISASYEGVVPQQEDEGSVKLV